MVVEWVALVISLVALGLLIFTWKKLRPIQQKKLESSSLVVLISLLVNKEIKSHKQHVVFWYWNRKDRNEPVYFENTKYAQSASRVKKIYNQASKLYEQDSVDKENFRELFGGTLVRFWRILEDEILHAQEINPDVCKSFQKVAKELMDNYGIVGEPYRTSPLLPEN